MTRRRLLAAAVTAVAAAALLTVASAGTAMAGEYPVYACEPAFGDVNHAWVPERTTPLMQAYSNCPVPSNELRAWNAGLVTLHPTSGPLANDPVGFLQFAALKFTAPPGAGLSRILYRHAFCGLDSYNAGLVNAAGTWLHASIPISCGSMVPSPWTLSLDGTPWLRLATTCVKARCQSDGTRVYATMRSATVWISDSTRPAVSIGGGSLVAGGWHAGTQSLVVNGWDNVGLQEVDVFLDNLQVVGARGRCDWTYTVPCSTPLAPMRIASPVVRDGSHTLTVRAEDSAGNWGSATARVYVDNTAPTSPQDLLAAGGESWRRTNSFSVSWTNPTQTGHAPIAAARWSICPATNAPENLRGCSTGSRSGTNIHALAGLHVPGPGDWVGRFWLVDSASNGDAASARAVHMRYDPAVPDIALLGVNPADPQRITATATDRLSGIERVEVEVRRDGDDAWIALPVTPVAGQYVAYIDDATLPGGRYVLRARAVDQAGNERSTELRGGVPAALDLPLRLRTTLAVGRARTLKGRHGHRRTVLRRRALAAFGEPVVLRGRLMLPGQNPLSTAALEVFEQTNLPGEPWRRIGLVQTDSQGRFKFKASPGPSRTLRFAYAGSPLIQPHAADVRLRVRAKTTFLVNRHRVVNGDEVRFRGRVRGRVPAGGKLVQLQAYSRGTWRTFATPRASHRTHRWHYWYRFSATRGLVRYRFRAVLPTESGFPYARGASHRLHVVVRGL